MKKFILAIALTMFQLLILPAHKSECLAGSVQASATVRLLSDLKNPVEGTFGLEQSGVRVSGSLGNDNRQSYALDLLARTKDGFYLGAGVLGDRAQEGGYSSIETDSTIVSSSAHDHGKHKGDKHQHGGKNNTLLSTSTTGVTFGSIELDLHPTILMGVSARRGLFVESRLIFGDGEMNNRTSVGLRF